MAIARLELIRRIQSDAANGFLTCEKNLQISSLIPQREIVATILSGLVVVLCRAKSWSYRWPVVITGGVLIYIIKTVFDRVILRRLAHIWKPIFENILSAEYQEACKKLQVIWNRVESRLGEGRITSDVEFNRFQFNVLHYRLSSEIIPIGLLYATLTLLSVKMGSNHSAVDQRIFADILNAAHCTSRGHVVVDRLQNLWNLSSPTLPEELLKPILSRDSLCLYNLIQELHNTPEESLIDNNRASCFEHGDLTFQYLQILKSTRAQNIQSDDLKLIERFLKCKTFRELWKEIQKLTLEEIEALERRSFGDLLKDLFRN